MSNTCAPSYVKRRIQQLVKFRTRIRVFDAAFYGRLDVLQLLIKQGADLEATNSRHENVLFAAIRGGQISTFSCLIEFPFLLEQTNKKGQTLFELAQKLSKTGIAPIRQKLKLMANPRNR